MKEENCVHAYAELTEHIFLSNEHFNIDNLGISY